VRRFVRLGGAAAIVCAALPLRADQVVFARQEVLDLAQGASTVLAADLDGDGDQDVVAGCSSCASFFTVPSILWYENDGNRGRPSFTRHWLPPDLGFHVEDLVATDLDGDGDADLVSGRVGGLAGGEVAWLENLGGSPPRFSSHRISLNTRDANDVHAADLDGDGDVDIVAASRRDDTIVWYENDGMVPPSLFVQWFITQDPDGRGPVNGFADGVTSVFAADVDGDGHMDLLSTSGNDDKVAWYQNDGGSPPSFSPHVIAVTADRAFSVFAADLDADGDMDVVSGSFADDKVAWYENLGGAPPAFVERVIVEDPDGPAGPLEGFADGINRIRVSDLDGDGDFDILSAAAGGNKIAWYENVGGTPPHFLPRVISTATAGAAKIFEADLDGDGDLDVISASFIDWKVAWYENLAAVPVPRPVGPAGAGR
jgi:hypothetical protein